MLSIFPEFSQQFRLLTLIEQALTRAGTLFPLFIKGTLIADQESDLQVQLQVDRGLQRGNTKGNGGFWLELRIRSRSADAFYWLLSRLSSGTPFLGPSLLL